SAKMTRDEILALFRVPAPVAGLVENMGLGADIWFGARVMFCEGTVQPKLDLIGQALTRDLGRRYGEDVVISFPDCSPRNQVQRREDDALDARTGLRTYNEIRRSRGLQPYTHPRALPPVGTCTRLDVQPERIVAETRFAKGVPFAEDLFRLYEQGVLRGWSIGFVPRRAAVIPPAPRRKRGLRVEEWDLLEYSAVPVP